MYFTKNGARNTFLASQSDSSCIIARARLLQVHYKITMATSSKEVGKETDHIKEKVILEEEALWAKLCSKLVSNNIYILKTPFKGRFMFFLIPVWMLDEKL